VDDVGVVGEGGKGTQGGDGRVGQNSGEGRICKVLDEECVNVLSPQGPREQWVTVQLAMRCVRTLDSGVADIVSGSPVRYAPSASG